jgi:hypothetical protein
LRYDAVVRLAWLWLVASGCVREPVDTCPASITTGQLVITEVRGDADTATGQWVELYNASNQTLDLYGLRIRFRRRDGGGETPVLVRRDLSVGPGEYVVLGRYFDVSRPAHVDYGFIDDHPTRWLSGAAIDVEACGRRVDLAQYDSLPATGTFSLGTMPPDHESNDLAGSWCFDPTPAGTPGAANTPCP